MSAAPTPSTKALSMRIGFITENFEFGGMERHTLTLLSHMDRTRYEPVLICRPGATPEFMDSEGVFKYTQVVKTELLDYHRKTEWPQTVLGLCRLFRRNRIDLIHVQLAKGDGARCTVMAARLARIPCVVTVHAALRQPLNWFDLLVSKILEGGSAVFTTVSEENMRSQIQDAGRSPKRIRVIYNAIDLDRFVSSDDEMSARALLGVPRDAVVVGTAGRLSPGKGIDTFLQAAKLICSVHSDAHFLIIGEGQMRSEYEALANALGIRDRVTFTGFRTDAARCLSAMDIFILASERETFGLVLAEAMAMGKPVVASRVGGIPEVVLDGVTGTLIALGDTQGIADAVLQYAHNPVMSAAHGRAGHERVMECFSIERLMRETEGLYAEMLQAR